MNRLLRLIPLLLLGGCALTVSKPALELPELDIPYEEFTLDNGLRLIVHEDRKTPIVAVNVWYHVGSKNEPAGRSGFAHLFEHLMFNGSEHFDDEFFLPLEEVGATSMNGTTNSDRTNYFANVPTPALDRLLWLESDRMGHLLGAITQEKLDGQRGVVQNEKRQGENRPYGRVWNLIPEHSYPAGHPYSWPTIGSIEDLNAASLEDVRDWFKTWYGAANAVIVIAGDISPDEAREKVEHYFGHIPAGPDLTRPKTWPAPMDGDRALTIADQVPQARSYFVWNVAPNYSRDLVHLQLAADALAHGKNSRLYKRLVYDQQTATDVGAFIVPRELGSQFVVVVTAKAGADIAKLERQLREEVDSLIADGPTAAEVERARTRLSVAFLRGLERVGGFGGKSDILASAAVLTGDPGAWREELDWLEAATPVSVRASTADWLSHGHLKLRVEPAARTRTSPPQADRSALPGVGDPPPLELPELQRTRLSNGLEVVLAERHAAPVVEMRLLAPSGYAADPAGQEGLATLTMQLLDEGAGELSALELAERLDALGASIGSDAMLDHCQVSLSAVKPTLEPALALYRQVLTAPAFPEDELARLRPRLLASIEQEKANPFQLGLRVLPPLLYGEDHPYGVPLTGSGDPQSLEAITRDDIQGFYRRHIRPENAQLLVVGDVTMAELEPLLERHLGAWQPPATDAAPAPIPTAVQPDQPRVFLLDRPDAPQSVILAGHLAPPPTHPEDLAMTTANEVFGGLFTSRVNMNLREDKGWAYGAGSAVVTAREQRPFVVYSRVQSDRTADSMREIRRELDGLLGSRPITAGELERVVRQRSLSLPGNNETAGQLAGSIGRILRLDLPDDYYHRFVAGLNAMTPAEVNAGAGTLIRPQALTWVIVGDIKRLRPQLEALDWGPLTTLDADGS